MRLVFFFTLPFFSLCAVAACGGGVSTSTTSGGGGGGGAGGSATLLDLGLGAPLCAPSQGNELNAELCVSTQACAAAADCSTVPSAACTTSLGTGTLDFPPAGCIDGHCAYHVVPGSCEDGTSCDACAGMAKASACAFQASPAACATCCVMRYAGADYAALYGACACGATGPCAGACSASALCGGAGPESDACVACLQTALTAGGACLTSAAFQEACIHEKDSVFCRKTAQCLVGCPAGGS